MCTLERRGPVYLLTLTGPTEEHRLNPALLASLLATLSVVRSDLLPPSTTKREKPAPAALVVAGEGKFFSNGFDLDSTHRQHPSSSQGPLLSSLLKQVMSALLSLPIPTVAAVTGHASAAGLILALSHDYLVMRSDRGFLYLSETDIGLEIPGYFVEVVKARVGGGKGLRDMVLASKKVTATEAVRMGVVDRAVEGEKGTVEAAVRLGMELAGKGWDGDVYARNRMAMQPEVCRMVGLTTAAKL